MTHLDQEMTLLALRTRIFDLGLDCRSVPWLREQVGLILESGHRVLDLMANSDQQTIDLLEQPDDNPLVQLFVTAETDPASLGIRPEKEKDFQDFCNGTGRWAGHEPLTGFDSEFEEALDEGRRFEAELRTLLERSASNPPRASRAVCGSCGRPIGANGHCGC